MRLMTYNILTGGRDGSSDARLYRVSEVIRRANPDILVLNECNDFERDAFRALYRLEAELGMRGVLAPASSGFHVAVFVRHGRLLETTLLDRELHHAALAARVELNGVQLTVVGAHLTPFGGDARLIEVQQLLRFVREEHVFIMGDLNAISPHDAAGLDTRSWLPRRRARHVIAESGGVIDTRAISALEESELVDTFRSGDGPAPPTVLTRLGKSWQDYQLRIDYIFATRAAAARVVQRERLDGELVDAASDHYPLVVDVDF